MQSTSPHCRELKTSCPTRYENSDLNIRNVCSEDTSACCKTSQRLAQTDIGRTSLMPRRDHIGILLCMVASYIMTSQPALMTSLMPATFMQCLFYGSEIFFDELGVNSELKEKLVICDELIE
ncbi:hypothetical protein HELRODRAFT_184123 [Helobdella robusta]|uniref:Uncharacterized protein n=1 Tax=Helobdella robusta TaxID=6412 RepID=T1FKM4_HELRO|nr:hypothetical protein HELRODRAFT_184123 [Helobdella robusta]ESO07462.1 hypothetical protein HELRODRAFT_184123 [Helobdella robusta]